MAIETLCRGKFLELKRSGTWEYVSRVKERGAAFILAVTDARELVLVEQHRESVQARCIELPAGIIGDEAGFEDEDVAAAALRELEEETGYRAAHAELLMTAPIAAGLASEMMFFFRATGLVRVHPGGGVADEDITVHVVPLADAADWLRASSAAGTLIDARIYAGLWFAGEN